MPLTLKCPAKLNLSLEVLGERSDGMHDIKSRFQLIDLYDVMTIKKHAGSSNIITIKGYEDLNNENNIINDALLLLSEYTKKAICCSVTVEKHIPVGGGLGGGSSNAATVLVAANKMYELEISKAKLMEMGNELGADVPFFINGKNVIASGTGNIFQTVESSAKKYLLLFPGVNSSTQFMFSKWKDSRNTILRSASSENHNSFLRIFLDKHQDIKEVFDLLELDMSLRMSGTGSTFFFEYEEGKEIEKTMKKIPTKWRHSFCEALQCSPLIQHLT